jgi:hypothetical protein
MVRQELRVNSRAEILPTYRIATPTVCATNSSVGFVGSYSNVEAVDRVRRLLPKLERLATEMQPAPPLKSPRKRERAPILDAVGAVLAEAETPMRAREIHAAVETMRGEPVAWSSVKDCLASNAKPEGRFIRIARGRYRLA